MLSRRYSVEIAYTWMICILILMKEWRERLWSRSYIRSTQDELAHKCSPHITGTLCVDEPLSLPPLVFCLEPPDQGRPPERLDHRKKLALICEEFGQLLRTCLIRCLVRRQHMVPTTQ